MFGYDSNLQMFRNLSRTILASLAKYEELSAARSAAYSAAASSKGTGSYGGTRDSVKERIEAADEVLAEFRTKMMALMDSAQAIFRDGPDLRHSSFSVFSHGSHSVVAESLEVSAVLEKYSDRLIEMVSDKISSSLNNKRDGKM